MEECEGLSGGDRVGSLGMASGRLGSRVLEWVEGDGKGQRAHSGSLEGQNEERESVRLGPGKEIGNDTQGGNVGVAASLTSVFPAPTLGQVSVRSLGACSRGRWQPRGLGPGTPG